MFSQAGRAGPTDRRRDRSSSFGAVSDRTAAVLGAGIQGSCAALALAARGLDVVLIDRMPAPMLRASLRNEGKIHLGFVYAKDQTMRTSELMFESAVSFARLLDEWTPRPLDWATLRSRPFTYLVMRDSMLAADELRAHYQRIADRCLGDVGMRCYLGTTLDHLWRDVPPPAAVAPGAVEAAIATEEIALDLDAFRTGIVAALAASDRITMHPGRRVESVTRTPAGFETEGEVVGPSANGVSSWQVSSDIVVNCLWDGRMAIDEQVGMVPDGPWVYRHKYRVLARLPDDLADVPALTMTLGPYGDIVPLPDRSYLSWYPVCRTGFSTDDSPPRSWQESCDGTVGEDVERGLAAEVCRALEHVVPGVSRSEIVAVDAGVVLGSGETDIDDARSGLHERHAIGVKDDDGYFSIDTGKLTCAPLFADRLARPL